MSETSTSGLGIKTDPFIGRTVLGRYRIVRPIGRGGMGLIYLARLEGAARFVKPVVVKRAAPDLLAKEPGIVDIMGREARIMSHLSHPSIVSVIDFAAEEGSYLLVLDYVHGFHLGQWSKYLRRVERPLPADLAIRIVCSVLDALHYAHTERGPDDQPLGIVHRDVSPGNVLIDLDGNVKLADFGIARMISDQTEVTSDKALIKGKFGYMAPELLTRADPSPSTDLYAAAVMLHEVLVGQNELRADSIERTLARILHHIPSSVRLARSDAPEGLDDVLAQALAKRPEKRFKDAAAFAAALRALPGMDEEALDRKLASAIAADFRDPKMAESLGVTDLATLDRAWRETPTESTAFEAVLPVGQVDRREADTLVAPPTVAPPGSRSRRVAMAGGALAGVGLLVLGVVLATRRAGGEAPAAAPVIVVNGQVSGADGLSIASSQPPVAGRAPPAAGAALPSAVSAAVSAAASAPVSPPTVQAPAASGARPPAHADGADALTRAFSKQQSQVARCFTSNAADVAGSPEISIHFGVDASGKVTSAQVLPPALASTPLGACLAGVARATQFPPQPHDVSFRIPIVARRAQ
jgi:serine/threonine-protein kinase